MESEIGADESVSTAVVRAVSAVEGRDSSSIPALSNVLDLNALDALFAPQSDGEPRTGGRLSIIHSNCRVTVDNGEYLTVQLLNPRQRTAQPPENAYRDHGE